MVLVNSLPPWRVIEGPMLYFSLTALDRLFRRHDLVLRDVERIPIHGGSLRVFVSRKDAAEPSAAVRALLAEEVAWGVVDRSTVKQGRYTPGTHLPILAPAALLERRPDYLLLLSWNVADEILAQQDAFRQQGGRFIIPIPECRIV